MMKKRILLRVVDAQWYSLDGQRVGGGQPTRKGVYVRGGKKVMTR